MAGGQKARPRIIHHFHGNCPSIGHLCNQRPIRPRVRLGCLCPVSASRHRQIRLSLTTLTPTRAHPSGPEWKREGTLIYFVPTFFFFSFLIWYFIYIPVSRRCLVPVLSSRCSFSWTSERNCLSEPNLSRANCGSLQTRAFDSYIYGRSVATLSNNTSDGSEGPYLTDKTLKKMEGKGVNWKELYINKEITGHE